MHYDPELENHGLKHSPFKSCVVPRPIGWISTLSVDGVPNLAPFSQFQNITYDPPIVMFAANQRTTAQRKDTVVNVEATGEFVWNMATWAQREAVNVSAEELPHGVDEFERAGLAKLPSRRVKPMRVAGSPIQFECVYLNTLRFPGTPPMGSADVVFGRVVGVHIDDDALDATGLVDVLKIRPIARMGYYDYTAVDNVFRMVIPGNNAALLAGLEGSADKTQQATAINAAATQPRPATPAG
jgi:flavin reductase (DIM6/NTAB) family NADH-FMN oxidoreductase RutF